MRYRSPVVLSLLLAACSSDDPANGILGITTGREDDTFTAEPAVTRIDVSFTDYDTNETTRLSRSRDVPVGIDLGSSGWGEFSLVGTDKDGNRQVAGRTPPVEIVSFLGGYELPLLAARTDRFSRVEENLAVSPREHPLVGMIGAGSLWVVSLDGANALSDGYNVGYWMQFDAPSEVATLACPTDPCDASTLAVGGGQWGILIGSDWAYAIDMVTGSGEVYEAPVPEDWEDWGEIAGGRSIPTPGYTAFVVGGTRAEEPTDALFELSRAGEYTGRRLHTPRALAGAGWMSKRGLVVVGGSAEGSGVEFRPLDDADTIVQLDYPADPVTGAAVLEETESTFLRVGGRLPDGTAAPTVRIDVDCEEDCETVPVPELDLDFVTGTGFMDEGNLLVVTEDEDGENTVYRLKDNAFVQLPLRQSRAHATPFSLPTGHLALVGGVAPGTTKSRAAIEVVAY